MSKKRASAGRPASQNPRKHKVIVWLNEDEDKRLALLCERRGLPLGPLLRACALEAAAEVQS